ncbi:Zn(II)2Cys6 transcription factor domain-containing protein [Aspergillus lucknowensis]|uniref:Zn(2)-C6 fungal-type domain-containing protein n=1 Tax=Aspergillus lucknowensis TaxID=176173 RepID=A0ABR4LJU7_9EURO
MATRSDGLIQKTRAACNRCHAQKLRCIRRTGQSRCERCSRLDAPCRFAPRAPRNSRQRASQETPNFEQGPSGVELPVPEAGYVIDFDPLVTDEASGSLASTAGHDVLNQAVTHQASQSIDEWNPLWCGDIDLLPLYDPDGQNLDLRALQIPASQPSILSTTQELANMSVALYELKTKLPSLPEKPARAECSESHEPHRSSPMPFVFEELFHHTTHFTNLIQDRLYNAVSDLSEEEATVLMVGSCLSRLVEMYTVIFSLVQRCLRHSLGPPRPRPGWAVILPEVRLGSLKLPAVCVTAEGLLSAGRGTMYIWMVVVFSGELWGGIAETVKRQRLAVDGNRGAGTLTGTVWAGMVDRVDLVLHSIKTTQGMLR